MNARTAVRHPLVVVVEAGSKKHMALLVRRGAVRVFVPVEPG